jgi:hypothetical protein
MTALHDATVSDPDGNVLGLLHRTGDSGWV